MSTVCPAASRSCCGEPSPTLLPVTYSKSSGPRKDGSPQSSRATRAKSATASPPSPTAANSALARSLPSARCSSVTFLPPGK